MCGCKTNKPTYYYLRRGYSTLASVRAKLKLARKDGKALHISTSTDEPITNFVMWTWDVGVHISTANATACLFSQC